MCSFCKSNGLNHLPVCVMVNFWLKGRTLQIQYIPSLKYGGILQQSETHNWHLPKNRNHISRHFTLGRRLPFNGQLHISQAPGPGVCSIRFALNLGFIVIDLAVVECGSFIVYQKGPGCCFGAKSIYLPLRLISFAQHDLLVSQAPGPGTPKPPTPNLLPLENDLLSLLLPLPRLTSKYLPGPGSSFIFFLSQMGMQYFSPRPRLQALAEFSVLRSYMDWLEVVACRNLRALGNVYCILECLQVEEDWFMIYSQLWGRFSSVQLICDKRGIYCIRQMNKEEHFSYKVVVLGDAGIGKTCLTLRYTDNTFSNTVRCTVGVDFRSKTIDIDDLRVKLNIFDTAGQQAYRSIVKTYYCGVDAVLFCYAINRYLTDLPSKQSFQQITSWLCDFYENSDAINCLKILVGTKSDCESERQVTLEQAKQLMQRESFMFNFETSALENKQVAMVFEEIARNLLLKTFKSKKTTQEQQSNKKQLTQMLAQPEDDQSGRCC